MLGTGLVLWLGTGIVYLVANGLVANGLVSWLVSWTCTGILL
jgi:hypothetical protein